MANYITTLKDDASVNTLSPRTVLKAIADDNGSYLSNQLTAANLNSLANGDANNIRSSSAISVYSTSSVYQVGDKVLYSGVLYRCITAGATGTWDSSKWSEISLAANSDAISNISASLSNLIKCETINLAMPRSGYGFVTASIPSNITIERVIGITFHTKIIGNNDGLQLTLANVSSGTLYVWYYRPVAISFDYSIATRLWYLDN